MALKDAIELLSTLNRVELEKLRSAIDTVLEQGYLPDKADRVAKRLAGYTEEKYIRRGDKLYGPYRYRREFDPETGKLKSTYLGKGTAERAALAGASLDEKRSGAGETPAQSSQFETKGPDRYDLPKLVSCAIQGSLRAHRGNKKVGRLAVAGWLEVYKRGAVYVSYKLTDAGRAAVLALPDDYRNPGGFYPLPVDVQKAKAALRKPDKTLQSGSSKKKSAAQTSEHCPKCGGAVLFDGDVALWQCLKCGEYWRTEAVRGVK